MKNNIPRPSSLRHSPKCRGLLRVAAGIAWLCASAFASDVSLVAGRATAVPGNAVALGFNNDSVLIHDGPLGIPDARNLARNVPREKIVLVVDRRPRTARTGYEILYSQAGVVVAIAKDPSGLRATPGVAVRPATASRTVVETVSRDFQKPDPAIQGVLNMFDESTYRAYLAVITTNVPTRYSCSQGNVQVRDWIRQYMESYGLNPAESVFENACWPSSCDNLAEGASVIGIQPGILHPEKFILVGAHFDSISPRACTEAPGANDNGSGTAALLQMIQVFSQHLTGASLVFAAFSGEEQGMLGSEEYVRNLLSSGQNTNCLGVVILDMISWHKNRYGVTVEGSSDSRAQRQSVLSFARTCATYTDLRPTISYQYGASDHEPFLDSGMSGALLIETDWDQCEDYHTTGDTLDKQDTAYALKITKAAAAIVAGGAGLVKP